MVQGIWSASLSASQSHHQSIEKTLFADAGSGIVFMLDGDAQVDGIRLPHGVIMLPVNTRADRLLMRPGAMLAGIRFQPAMGYRLFARHYHQLTRLDEKDDQQCTKNGTKLNDYLDDLKAFEEFLVDSINLM